MQEIRAILNGDGTWRVTMTEMSEERIKVYGEWQLNITEHTVDIPRAILSITPLAERG